ncbi:uncharacterized protein [Leptinotarsa decemlineata]|uniref:uncharacterized protein n=1 Tax=Leptinotarsa decemlineata TaxID=7539 RepID=UPI003D3061F6
MPKNKRKRSSKTRENRQRSRFGKTTKKSSRGSRKSRHSRGSKRVRLSEKQLVEFGVSTALHSLRERNTSNVLAKVIPDFDPSKENISEWLTIIDEHAECYGWDENSIKFQTLNKLKGTAESWYHDFIKDEIGWAKFSWSKWKKLLNGVFQADRNTYALFMDIAHHKPHYGESLYSFYFDHLAKINKLKAAFSETDKISLILGAIGNETISSSVKASGINKLNSLANYLKDRMHDGASTSKSILNYETNSRSSTVTKFQSKSQNKSQTKTKYECHICGKIGHMKRDCNFKNIVKEQTCRYCNRNGHFEAACFKKKNDKRDKDIKKLEVNLISTGTKNKFFRNISINNQLVSAFIDFGSDCSVLQRQTAERLYLKPSSLTRPITLAGFLGDGISVQQSVKASVDIGEVCLNCEFYIIDDYLESCECIIDRNFTENKVINYCRMGDELCFFYARQNICQISEIINSNMETCLQQLLYEYRNILSVSFDDLKQMNCEPMKIMLTTDNPISRNPYRVAETEKSVLNDIIAKLIKTNIIQESRSPYASPVLLVKKKNINARISRWVLSLQECTYTIEHKPGQQMRHVDALSRNPIPSRSEKYCVESVMLISEGDWLAKVQNEDPEIRRIKEILESGLIEDEKDIFNNYDLRAGKVFKITANGRRWVVPKNCRWQVIQANHDEMGHFSVEKTPQRVMDRYWFPKMRRFITKYVKSCLHCQYYKAQIGKKPGFLFSIVKYARPFHTLHIDHVGPFIETKDGNKYLLVIVDSFTKFTFVTAVPNTKSKPVIEHLTNIISIFGSPTRLISDAGKAFVSSKLRKFCTEKGIRHYHTAIAMPRANGQVERFNKTILDAVAASGANIESDEWDRNIDRIQLGINSTVNKTIRSTPAEVFFGIKLNATGDRYVNHVTETPAIDVTKLREEVGKRLEDNRKKQDEYCNRKRMSAPDYQVGDKVLVKVMNFESDGCSKKLREKFKGPFTVQEVIGNDRYRVKDDLGSERCKTDKRYEGVIAAEHMKPFITRTDDI